MARFRFRFRTTFLILLLVVQMVPAEALVIPMFIDLKRLGLLNSLIGLTAVYVGFALPFGVWMLRGFVAAVPKELEEAAAIDGAGPVRIFFRILFPLVAPGLVATSIFSFITAWNELIFAYTFLKDQDKATRCRSCCSSSSGAPATTGVRSWPHRRCSPSRSSPSSSSSSVAWCPAWSRGAVKG